MGTQATRVNHLGLPAGPEEEVSDQAESRLMRMLGVRAVESDAVTIISTAQLRLRALRSSLHQPCSCSDETRAADARDRIRRIAAARDGLLVGLLRQNRRGSNRM
ncbi:MAG: hypothetical protein ACKO4T_09350 [Planctomycetaceae bacterium]